MQPERPGFAGLQGVDCPVCRAIPEVGFILGTTTFRLRLKGYFRRFGAEHQAIFRRLLDALRTRLFAYAVYGEASAEAAAPGEAH